MRKSDGVLWDDVRNAAGCYFDDYNRQKRRHTAAFASAIRADEAEHVRQECVEVVKDFIDPDPRLVSAILNAGKAPALKPGMLVKDHAQRVPWRQPGPWIRKPFVWQEGDDDNFVPLTKAEIMREFVDKAPE